MNAVTAQDLTKLYSRQPAVQDLEFEIKKGEFVGLLGPNGAGKTTTLHMLIGILNPTAGKVVVLGHDVHKDRYAVYPRINFSSAYIQLPFNLKVKTNLKIYAKLYGLKDLDRRIDELMHSFHIEHLSGKKTGALSSGETTRLNLVKSLMTDPEVLFLDEPTASLDPDIAERVQNTLLKLQQERGMTVIYTSHNMSEVEQLCERILFMHQGRLLFDGRPSDLRARYGGRSLDEVFIDIARNKKDHSADTV